MSMLQAKDPWFAAAIKMAIASSIFLLMPSYLDIISRQFHVPIDKLTYLATIELLGFALAPLLCFIASKLQITIKENIAIMLLAACHLGSVFCESVDLFLVLRSIAGICAGIVLVRCFESLAHNKQPDTAFAKAIALQTIYSALIFVLMPSMTDWFGIDAFFVALAVLSISLLLLKVQLPLQKAYSISAHAAITINYRLLVTGLVALLMFMTTQSAVWSLLGVIATEHQMSLQAQGNVLAAGTLFSLLGAGLSGFAINYFRNRRLLIISSLMLQALVFSVLFSASSALMYMLAVASFMLLWNFILPLFLGAIAEADQTGQAMRFVVAAQTVGAALGPSVVLRGWVELELLLLLLITLVLIYPLISRVPTMHSAQHNLNIDEK